MRAWGFESPSAHVELEEMAVEVEQRFAAPPDVVYALLHDVARMAGLGPEHEAAEWVTPTLFTGWNRSGEHAWETPCHVIVDDPPRAFGWTVGTPGRQSSTWTYELVPDGDGTIVRQRMAHGPGRSAVRTACERHPERVDAIIDGRCEQLRQNMTTVLAKAAELVDVSRA